MTWENSAQPSSVTLRVAKDTIPVNLKTAIVGYLRSGRRVTIDTIGVATNYIATKAAVLARAEMDVRGIRLKLTPALREYEVDGCEGGIRTGIQWIIEVEGR